MWYNERYPFMSKKSYNSKALQRYAEYENNRQWQDVFNRLTSICCNLFEWTGLPNTCDGYFLEKILLFYGKACIIYDEDFSSFLTLPCTEAGGMNLYYENSYYRAISLGYSKEFLALTHYNKDIFKDITNGYRGENNIFKGVVCEDNYTCYPMINKVEIATTKIADSHRAIDIARKQLKVPTIIETDEETKLSIQKSIELIDSNVLAVYATRDMAKRLRETKPLNTFVNPSNLTALWDNVNNEYSEFLTAFGIDNLNTADKKERLISDEVNSNDENIALNIAYRLDMRKHFCENFNDVFADKLNGNKIDVRIRHEFEQNSYTEKGEIENNDGESDNGRSADDT